VEPRLSVLSVSDEIPYDYTVEAEHQHGKYVFDQDLGLYMPGSGSSYGDHRAPTEPPADHDYRLAWLWVVGWRARLTKAGDAVERCRWEWRLDDMASLRNLRSTGSTVMLLKDARTRVVAVDAKAKTRRKKSVHWAE
jgi:hypothetical protein